MSKQLAYYTVALSLFIANVHSIEWLPEGKVGDCCSHRDIGSGRSTGAMRSIALR